MAANRGPVTIAELSAGLLWPGAFRAVGLALQPARVALGFLVIAVLMGVGTLFDAVAGPVVATSITGGGGMSRLGQKQGLFEALVNAFVVHLNRAVEALLSLDFASAGGAIGRLWFDAIPALARSSPGAFAALIILLLGLFLPVRMVVAGAIARMAAVEVAHRRALSVREALLFAASRWKSLVGAQLLPALVVGALCAALIVAGVLFRAPVLDALGALGYGMFLLLGAIVVILSVFFAFAAHLTFPAVAADGADAVDAVQRAYAYAFTRPGRAAVYFALFIAIGVIAYAFAALLVMLTLNATASLLGVWSAADTLAGGYRWLDFSPLQRPTGVAGSGAVADGIIGVWERLIVAILAGFVVSYHDCAATLMYLFLRRINDEQDVEDIWSPAQPAGPAPPPA